MADPTSIAVPQASPVAPPTVNPNAGFYSPDQNPQTANGGATPPISTASLSSPQTPISLPTQPPVDTHAATNASIPTPAEAVAPETTPTATENAQSGILAKIAGIMQGKTSLATLQTQQEAGAGVPNLTKTVNDLTVQLTGLNDQATALQNAASPGGSIQNQEQLAATGRGITAGGLSPLTAADLRKNQIQQATVASQALTLKSVIAAAQGNLTIAKAAADRAAQVQFDATQQEIDYQNSLLAAIQPQLTKDQKAQADIVQAQLADRQKQVDLQISDYKTGQAAIADALKMNPNNAQAQAAVTQAAQLDPKDPQYLSKVQQLVGQYASDVAMRALDIQAKQGQVTLQAGQIAQLPLDRQLKQAQVSSAQADAYLKRMQASFYGSGGSGGGSTLPATPEIVALGQTPTATGAPRYTGNDPTSINAQAILDGLNQPPVSRGTTPANMHLMAVLNQMSLQQTGHAYDQQAAKAAYDFRTKTATPFFAKLPTAVTTITNIASLAKQANVSNFSQLNDVVNTGRAAGWFTTDAQQSAAKQLQSALSLNSDDLGLLLGTGQGSDSKLALASAIFDPNGGVKSTNDLQNYVTTTLAHKAEDYAKQSGIANPDIYAHNIINAAVNRSAGGNTDYAGGAAAVEPTDHSRGATWSRPDGTYISDGTQWVKQK